MHQEGGGGRGRPDRLDRSSIERKLDLIIEALKPLTRKVRHMIAAMEELRVAMARNTSVGQGFLAFVRGLGPLLIKNAENAAEIRKIAGDLNKESGEFEAALLENTTPAPTPPPVVDPNAPPA